MKSVLDFIMRKLQPHLQLKRKYRFKIGCFLGGENHENFSQKNTFGQTELLKRTYYICSKKELLHNRDSIL